MRRSSQILVVCCALLLLIAPSGSALIPNIPAGIVTSHLTVNTRLGVFDRAIRSAPKPLIPGARPRVSGRGVFIVDIDVTTGFALDVRVLESTGHKTLDDAAADALRKWTFQPRSVYKVTVPIEFRPSGQIQIGS